MPRSISTAVFLIVLIPSLAAYAQPPRTVLTDVGAIGDGSTVNTQIIQAAIDKIAAAGNGVLVVPAGTFLSGALFFHGNVNVEIQKDGVLKSTTRPADFPLVNTRWEGVEGMHTSAFLNFDDMKGVSVSGEGTVDGSADQWGGGRFGRRGFGAGTTRPTTQFGRGGFGGGNFGAGGFGASTNPSTRPTFVFQQVGRPRLICFKNCSDVRISDLHLQKQAIWCLHFLYCQNVTADNLNIRSFSYTPSSDGIDVDSCDGVTITRCDIACDDDNIAIKSGKDADGRRVNRPSENIHIADCTFGHGDGLACGSEVTGSVRHMLVENCTFNGTNHCARFKSQPSRGGVIEDVTFRNITLNNPTEAFDFEMAWNLRLQRFPAVETLTVCRNIQLIDFHGTTRAVGEVLGIPGGEVRDVKFVNCNITAERGLRVKDAVNLDESGLNLTVANGPKIIEGNAATQGD